MAKLTASMSEAKTRIQYKLYNRRRSELVVTPRRHEVIPLPQVHELLASGNEQELLALVHQLSSLSLWVQQPESGSEFGSLYLEVDSVRALEAVTDWLERQGLSRLRSIEERIAFDGHEAAFEFALFARRNE